MSYWWGKVILVTGSTAGFGRVLADACAAAGARVVLSGRDPDRLDAAVEALRRAHSDRMRNISASGPEVAAGDDVVSGCVADVTLPEQTQGLVDYALDRYGRLDGLINNVGQSDRGLALGTPPQRFRELWETNFLTAVQVTQAAMPAVTRAGGHVVFMGSLASKVAARYLGAYPASKFPLAGFAQQLRLELAGSGVHVLLVCPGPIAREDAGARYAAITGGLPASAGRPGGGVKLKGIPPQQLAAAILRACEQRRPELVVPARARLLFALSQLWPALGDWLVRRTTS